MAPAQDIRINELVQSADRALQSRDAMTALRLLREAEARAPGDLEVKMQLALALRTTGDLASALEVLDAALSLDPYHLLALLSKGWMLEKLDRPREAAEVYRNALKIAPPEDRVSAGLKAPLARAREVVAQEADRAESFLLDRIKQVRERHPDQKLDRFDLSLKAFVGKARIYSPQPALLHYPGLPAEQFYDREHFPWLPELEAGAEAIREELLVVMREDLEQLEPYIQYPPGVPVNQWVELNHSPRWNSYFLWRDGEWFSSTHWFTGTPGGYWI